MNKMPADQIEYASLPELLAEIGRRTSACIVTLEIPRRVGTGTDIIAHRSPDTSIPHAYGLAEIQSGIWSNAFDGWTATIKPEQG